MPLVIEVIERIQHVKPRVVGVAIGFLNGPHFSAACQTPQLTEKRRAMAMMGRQLGVTHLVNQDATFGACREAALNEDLMARRLIQAVASVQPRQVGSAPHRARGDAAVKELDIQVVEQSLDNGPWVVVKHSRRVTFARDISNQLLADVSTWRWPCGARPNTSSFGG